MFVKFLVENLDSICFSYKSSKEEGIKDQLNQTPYNEEKTLVIAFILLNDQNHEKQYVSTCNKRND